VASFRLAGPAGLRERSGRRAGLSAYHFRAGSVSHPWMPLTRRGVPTICDYSSVHPAVVISLVRNAGRLPAGWSPLEATWDWRLALADLERADWIIVNSHFVRDTIRVGRR